MRGECGPAVFREDRRVGVWNLLLALIAIAVAVFIGWRWLPEQKPPPVQQTTAATAPGIQAAEKQTLERLPKTKAAQ